MVQSKFSSFSERERYKERDKKCKWFEVNGFLLGEREVEGKSMLESRLKLVYENN